MKTAIVTAMALVGISSIPFHAQQASVNTQQSVQASAGNRNVSESSSAGVGASRSGVDVAGSGAASASGPHQMSQVQGELVSKLDSKSARVGDPVIVKTTQKVKTADGMVIPKGSRLIGHVTSVEAHGRGSEGSRLAVDFDRAQLRGGQSMAIRSVIQSVSPAANMAASAAEDDDMAMGAPMGGGGGMVRGGGGGLVRGGGGLVGGATGAVGGAVHGVGSTVGAAGSGVASATGSVARDTAATTGRVAGGATATAGNGLRATGSGAGSLAAHATGVPGVMLAGDASGATSGTLSAARRNVHLDSGTQMVLGVSTAVNR